MSRAFGPWTSACRFTVSRSHVHNPDLAHQEPNSTTWIAYLPDTCPGQAGPTQPIKAHTEPITVDR